MQIKKEKLERICLNCNQFLSSSMEEATEYGICLSDEDFAPFIEELLEKSNYSCCQDLIDSKKFLGEREACENYEEMELIEIDDNSPLGQELKRLCESGELNPETFKAALLEEQIRNIDWKTMPVDRYVKQLESSKKEEREAGVSSLGAMIALGNKEAFKQLLKYFKKLPPPKTLEEVYFKIDVLGHLEHGNTRLQMIPCMIDKLYKTPSNNTTRQWILAIFRFLEDCPKDKVREPLEKMLKDKRFSYRLKKKIKSILYSNHFEEI